jgi:hypothetical protein
VPRVGRCARGNIVVVVVVQRQSPTMIFLVTHNIVNRLLNSFYEPEGHGREQEKQDDLLRPSNVKCVLCVGVEYTLKCNTQDKAEGDISYVLVNTIIMKGACGGHTLS